MRSQQVRDIVREEFLYPEEVLDNVFFSENPKNNFSNLFYMFRPLQSELPRADLSLSLFSAIGRHLALLNVVDKVANGTPFIVRNGAAETQIILEYLKSNQHDPETIALTKKLILLSTGLVYRYADAIVVHSSRAQSEIMDFFKLSSDRFVYIPNSADTAAFRQHPLASERRRVSGDFNLEWNRCN